MEYKDFRFEYEYCNDNEIRLYMTYKGNKVYMNRFVDKNNIDSIIKAINDLYSNIELIIKESEVE